VLVVVRGRDPTDRRQARAWGLAELSTPVSPVASFPEAFPIRSRALAPLGEARRADRL